MGPAPVQGSSLERLPKRVSFRFHSTGLRRFVVHCISTAVGSSGKGHKLAILATVYRLRKRFRHNGGLHEEPVRGIFLSVGWMAPSPKECIVSTTMKCVMQTNISEKKFVSSKSSHIHRSQL